MYRVREFLGFSVEAECFLKKAAWFGVLMCVLCKDFGVCFLWTELLMMMTDDGDDGSIPFLK